MGVLDQFKSTVLTTYKVDTKPMKKGLKDLDKAQKKQAQSAIDAAEKQNEAMDSQIAMLGKVAIGVGAVVAAYKAATVGLEAYEKRSRLTAATAGVSIKGLQKATKGLVTETKLLEFASKAMNGTFKLSQTQMEEALRGAIALRNEGHDLSKVLENVGKSIAEGTVEPLKEFGHVVTNVTNDTREGLNAALKELGDTAREQGPNLRLPADEMTAAQVDMKNAVDDLKSSLGQLAIALAPVVKAIAKMVGLLSRMGVVSDAIAGIGYEDRIGSEKLALVNQLAKGEDPALRRRLDELLTAEVTRKRADTLEASMRSNQANVNRVRTKTNPVTTRSRRTSGGGFTLGNSAILDDGLDIDPGGFTGRNSQGHAALREQAAETRAILDEIRQGGREVDAALEKFNAEVQMMAGEKHMSSLEQIFGTTAEMDEYTAKIQVLTMGFDALADGVGRSVDALITGGEAFKDGFKSFLAESLRGMAVEMAVMAIRETGFGLAALANPLTAATAPQHFAAAKTFGVAAIAAGAGARLLGAGGAGASSPRTAGSAGVGASNGGSGSDDGGKTNVFIVGNDFAGMNSRQRESMWRQTSRSAGVQIDGDVVLNG